ncbi:MAG TPA: ATPase, T2SS/T4P/T4SS family [bacterium]|nr:ATPase, T2SS/T4P/T4SS family [bacterium]
MLVEEGLISLSKLDEALKMQRATGKRLGEVMQDMELLVADQILDILSKQLDVPKIDLFEEGVDREVASLIDPELIQRHKAIPVRLEGNDLVVAMVDPLNLMAIDDIRLATGYEVQPRICSEQALERIYQDMFGVSHEAKKHIDEWKQIQMKEGNTLKEMLKQAASLSEIEDAPIVRFVEAILEGAVDQRASDVHLEPKEDKLIVRYRVDGMLHKVMDIPIHAQSAVVARLKILAGLDTSERRRPQDGRIDLRVRDRNFDIRFSTLPTLWGEKVVMRLLDKGKINFSLEMLGFEKEELEVWQSFITRPHGIIYITGPTGSGKSTTLIASLASVANEKINVVTVEDPVEYQLPAINQVQVNPKVDFSFAQALRTILRQDPDVIMVGETRDRETAELAINAALTGHLVFSTLHTNDAAGGIIRLNNMGVERFLIVASVLSMVAQRLLRILCRNCKTPYEPGEDEMALIRPYLPQTNGVAVKRIKLYAPKGCEVCHNLGYSGRQAIYEILPLSRKVREMTMANASVQDIKKQARAEGMNTLFESGLKKIFKGQTSIQELFRVASIEEDEDSGSAIPGTEERAFSKPLLEELPEDLAASFI